MLEPKEFYDTMAPYYDDFIEQTRYAYFSLEQERQFIESFLTDGTLVLDLGCGTGRTMKLLTKPDRNIIGIDISFKMLEKAHNLSLNVIQSSANTLPFIDNFFSDVYSLHMGFGYCKNEDEVVKIASELFRVLKKDGHILLDTPHRAVRGEKYTVSWQAGNKTIDAVSYAKDKDEIFAALTKIGFKNIRFFGAYSQHTPLQDDSRRIIVSATK